MKDRSSPVVRRSKYDRDRKALALPGINYKNHFYTGFQWTYTNRMGVTYLSTLTEKGWKCECMGFTHHGKCKHIVQAHERLAA